MLRKYLAIAAVVWVATAGMALAQRTGGRGGQTGGSGRTGGAQQAGGSGQMGGTASDAGAAAVPGQGLDLSQVVPSADQAFAGGIERGATVGRSSETVTSFSGLSQAAPAGQGTGRRGATAGGVGGLGGFGGMGGMGAMGGLGGFNQFGGFGGQQPQQQGIRTRVRSAVVVNRPAPAQRAREIGARVQRAVSQRQMGTVAVQMDGGTAVLTGRVESEDRRGLVERLLLLEPGVRSVRNELVVSGPEEIDPGRVNLP